MDGINWGALGQQRNIFSDFTGGMEAGQEMRQAEAKRKAMNLFATDPKGAEQALLSAGDYKTAEALRQRREAQEADARRAKVGGMVQGGDYQGAQREAIAGGDFDMAKTISQMTSEQRKVARENAQDLGGFALGLKQLPPEQRKSVIASARDTLLQRGFTQEQIDGFDPSDANLDALGAQAMTLEQALAEQGRLRDDKRADLQAEEARRHNRVVEGQGAARVGISRGQLGLAQERHRARLKAGGYGTPGVGGAAIPDDDVEIDP